MSRPDVAQADEILTCAKAGYGCVAPTFGSEIFEYRNARVQRRALQFVQRHGVAMREVKTAAQAIAARGLDPRAAWMQNHVLVSQSQQDTGRADAQDCALRRSRGRSSRGSA